MDCRITWPNHTHFLLGGVQVTLTVDGLPVALNMSPGVAEGTLPVGTADPPVAVLTVEFQPTITGTAATVLRIVQTFQLLAPSSSLLTPGGPQPTQYTVRPPGAASDVVQAGRHPLIQSFESLGFWRVVARTDVVDATAVQPLLLRTLNVLRTTGPKASVRLLARTDGKLPLHYICATPQASASAPNSDILCFLTPPQKSPAEVDSGDALTDPAKFAALGARVAIFLGTGRHDNTLPAPARDHFSPGAVVPNVVVPRRWEEALVAAGKHTALVLPVPSSGSHNTAATGDLPVQLRQVHAALVALGDIAAPAGSAPGTPLLGVAGHSNGGPSVFAAVRASARTAFSEIWLFEALTAAKSVDTLARTTGTRILYAGYERSSVEESFAAAKLNPALSGRISRLPDPPPAVNATPAALAASSPMLTHMLEGIVTPASAWNPPATFKLPSGERYNQRFEVLHQLIVQGNDADGDHFLTKALKRSSLR